MIPQYLKNHLRRLRKIDPKAFDTQERKLLQKHDLGLMDKLVQHRSPSAFQIGLGEIERLWGSLKLD